jgi:dephospho-CoA kinase
MYIVGITGLMGSGKTFISHHFESSGDCAVFNSDKIAKDIHKNEMRELLIERHGPQYFKEDGEIDIDYSRPLYFSGTDLANENLAWHKHTIDRIFDNRLMKFAKDTDRSYVLLESALLFEYNLTQYCDEIIYVQNEDAKTNALNRDGITEADYNQRMSTQMPFEEKNREIDYIITNRTFDECVFDRVGWINEQIVRHATADPSNLKVKKFARMMIRELYANEHKGDWQDFKDLDNIYKEIDWHQQKLNGALNLADTARIKEYAADCANNYMFLLNALGHLH